MIMQAGVTISIQADDGTEIGTTSTNMMGAYEFELMTTDIPMGTNEISVVANDLTIRTVTVMEKAMDAEEEVASDEDEPSDEDESSASHVITTSSFTALVTLFVMSELIPFFQTTMNSEF